VKHGQWKSFVDRAPFCNTLAYMVEMSLSEAQLFRMLISLFGKDNIVWSMSVRTVCGGHYPLLEDQSNDQIRAWAEESNCLFTLVDDQDIPKMVIEFAPDFNAYIELQQIERQQRLPALLNACGIQYITVSVKEFKEMLDSTSNLDLISFLKDKFGIEEPVEQEGE